MAEQEKVHHNINYLKKEAQNLALRQKITLGASPLKKLGPLLQESHDILNDAYRELVRAVKQKRELSTAAEWFVDNYYIIQEQFVEVEEDLPPSYYKKLPRLLKGEYRGLPRIYELIQLLATVNDNVIDKENTIDAVQAFQEEEALKIGELWAIPIMIRLVLLLRLTDKIEELKKFRLMRRKIDELLDEIQQHENREPGFLLRQLSDMAYEQPSDERYLCLLAQRLQARGMLTDSERQWFDYKFSQWNTTLEGEMRQEAQ
ncbi:MAG TPA: hypothetical protein VE868_10110, partial [Balneolaceae bacterium]|nr:hypothetical protein [Balneolaceae bacterium]